MYEKIINELESEISTLETAKKLLSGTTVPKKPAAKVISSKGRANMAAAQKKRWAQQKKTA